MRSISDTIMQPGGSCVVSFQEMPSIIEAEETSAKKTYQKKLPLNSLSVEFDVLREEQFM